MKKLMIVIAVVFAGCETTVTQQKTNDKMWGIALDIVVIDSCEYIVYPGGNATWGTHKGNCKFCKQRNP